MVLGIMLFVLVAVFMFVFAFGVTSCNGLRGAGVKDNNFPRLSTCEAAFSLLSNKGDIYSLSNGSTHGISSPSPSAQLLDRSFLTGVMSVSSTLTLWHSRTDRKPTLLRDISRTGVLKLTFGRGVF